DDLLARVIDARERMRPRSGPTPILLKIAPDLTLPELDDVVGVARKRRVDGMIVGNTTITRPGSLRDRGKTREQGGLSGRPLFKLSTRMLAETFVRAEGMIPIVGVGGVDSGATAIAKISAGATLLQLYSALVYHGIGLVSEIKADLTAALKRGHRNSLASMVGSDAAAITAESWPGAAFSSARRVDHPHDEPDRDDDHRTQQEVAPQLADRVEAHVPDRSDQPLDAVYDVERIEAERRKDHAHQNRYQNQAYQHSQRRAAHPTRDLIFRHYRLHSRAL